jgi:K(+)-stimulated pyrophosphate-energized sodium pump
MDLSFIFAHKLVVSLIAGIASIAYALLLSYNILSKPRGDKKMNDIADAISEGAAAYMKRQYAVVAIIGAIIAVILYFAFGMITALGFAVGAIFSTIAGVVGMSIAVRSNIRTAQAAKKGLAAAFNLAFQGGAVTGLMVAGLALLSVTGLLTTLNCAWLWRIFNFCFCKTWRRNLYQISRCWNRHGRQNRKRNSRR